jgi:hypothetical protein
MKETILTLHKAMHCCMAAKHGFLEITENSRDRIASTTAQESLPHKIKPTV